MGGNIRNIRFGTVFWIAVFCIALVLTAQAAYSARLLEVDPTGRQCTEEGKAKFNFFYQSGEGSIDLEDDVKVFADGHIVKGKWYQHNTEVERTRVWRGQRAEFRSDPMEFEEDKVYEIKVVYPEENGKDTYFTIDMDCPGFEFSCELFSMELLKCYNRGGSIFLEIEGNGFGKTGANLREDFRYYLQGTYKRHEDTLVNMSAEISQVNDNLYLIEVPLGYKVNWAYIRGRPYGCVRTIDDLDTITYKKCTTISESEEPASEPAPKSSPVTGAATADTKSSSTPPPASSGEKSDESKPSFFSRLLIMVLSIFRI